MTAIYHITHVDNLPAILAAGALWSDSRLRAISAEPKNMALFALIVDRLER